MVACVRGFLSDDRIALACDRDAAGARPRRVVRLIQSLPSMYRLM
jgi:hypothetical protein